MEEPRFVVTAVAPNGQSTVIEGQEHLQDPTFNAGGDPNQQAPDPTQADLATPAAAPEPVAPAAPYEPTAEQINAAIQSKYGYASIEAIQARIDYAERVNAPYAQEVLKAFEENPDSIQELAFLKSGKYKTMAEADPAALLKLGIQREYKDAPSVYIEREFRNRFGTPPSKPAELDEFATEDEKAENAVAQRTYEDELAAYNYALRVASGKVVSTLDEESKRFAWEREQPATPTDPSVLLAQAREALTKEFKLEIPAGRIFEGSPDFSYTFEELPEQLRQELEIAKADPATHFINTVYGGDLSNQPDTAAYVRLFAASRMLEDVVKKVGTERFAQGQKNSSQHIAQNLAGVSPTLPNQGSPNNNAGGNGGYTETAVRTGSERRDLLGRPI